jgi:hypothetical protein
LVDWLFRTDAPTPFLVGMPTASLPAILPPDVYTVDLDQGRISLGLWAYVCVRVVVGRHALVAADALIWVTIRLAQHTM